MAPLGIIFAAILIVVTSLDKTTDICPQATRTGDDLASMVYVSIRTGDPHIFVRNRNGIEYMLTQGKGVHPQPTISVEGRIAYVMQINGVPTIHTMREDGTENQRLPLPDAVGTSPSWSPDGNSLAFFARTGRTGPPELHIFDFKQAISTKFGTPGKGIGPSPASWSADGKRLAFLAKDEKGKNQVFIAERESGRIHNLSANTASRGASWADLSPDGRQVVWVADMRERRPIIVTDAETGHSRVLTEGVSAGHESPRWSPDGRQIAFVSNRGSGMNLRNDVFVMDANGNSSRNLSQHPMEDFDPKWSADGQSIVFASLRTGTTQIFEVTLVDEVTRQLTNNAFHDMDHVLRPMAVAR